MEVSNSVMGKRSVLAEGQGLVSRAVRLSHLKPRAAFQIS